ncbi:MAG: LptF/LptG family permease, partial [Duncaniella sp.]|nr:LptF/LptG family permease [Duncaniella sp.]
MFRIKRMDIFILQSFVPLFMMTFCICLFIVLMQFLWRYIDDLVGKGLGVDVIAELFFYAALTMIPMALPLAILLASLMTFGNLGEQFELTAMKASGISLLRTMAPLIVLMVMIATGAFFFQNNVLPVAQTKMWTLLYSMRQKSPELEIPEGVFYDQIPGYNLFVQEKNRDTGVLYEMMIYDVSKGFENSSIILADSGKMSITPDKTHLFLRLWNGESFENIRDAGASNMRNVPYRRESFSQKDIMLKFDANFNRMDEQGMRSQYVGKNMAELQASIDSMSHRVDSIGDIYGTTLREYPYMGLRRYDSKTDDEGRSYKLRRPDVALARPVDVDSVFRGSSSGVRINYLSQALSKAERTLEEYKYKSQTMAEEQKLIRRHAIELQKKFTLSFACVIFFFIGAPLGAIIRKGGLGTPLVISVFLFIFYYIIDNMGYKFARDGKWEVWEGMWLSAAVLLPLGIFFTYKDVNDSAVF